MKGRGGPESEGAERLLPGLRAGCGDLEGQPEQECCATPTEHLKGSRTVEQKSAKPEGDQEEHQAHAEADAEHRSQTTHYPQVGARGRQEDVAGTGCAGSNEREHKGCKGLFGLHDAAIQRRSKND